MQLSLLLGFLNKINWEKKKKELLEKGKSPSALLHQTSINQERRRYKQTNPPRKKKLNIQQ
jgi:hypothetical protein